MAGHGSGADLVRMLTGQEAAYQVSEIPRRTDPHAREMAGQRSPDPDRAYRVAALTAAYHAATAAGGAGIAYGWLRTEAGGPVRILVTGDVLASGSLDGQVLLTLPAGARGTALPPGEFARLTGRIGCWRLVAGISDGLLAPAGETAPGATPGGADGAGGAGMPPLDEGLLGGWTGPFGWLVIAEPLSPGDLTALADEAGRRQRFAEGMADRFPEQAVQARRLKERHDELQRGASAGFWRITVAAGGPDTASAARVAGLLCASMDLTGLPYALSPARQPEAPGPPGAEPGGDAIPASPFCGSTRLLAALARPPESEVPGIRMTLRPEFDVTPDAANPAAGLPAIRLGDILDANLLPAGPFTIPAGSLNRHVLVCGATGAGKSQTVRSLLESATAHGIGWLVIEPAKAEYRLMASRLPDAEVIRIRPGEPDAIAAGLNPLEPAAGGDGTRFPLQTHADLVRALFIASFQAEEPFPQVLGAALVRAYADAGWDLALGEPVRAGAAYPTLTGLQRAADRVVSEIGYSQRVTDDVLGFMRVRIGSLGRGTTGRFLEGGHPLDFGALLRGNAVLEIEDVGDDADKAFLMGTVLIRLAEHLRLTQRTAGPGAGTGLRHLTVVEEAHRLLRRESPAGPGGGAGAAGHAVQMFAGLLAEIRAYGEGLIIAEQIPALLLSDVIKNTAVKIVHRLPAADDREAVGATMNATPAQSRFLVTLRPGQAAVSSDGMDFPVLIRVDDGTERERLTAVRTAEPSAVVRPRSATCGTECTARPCTLRDMRRGQRVLDDLPWVRLWAELAVLAHLTGWPAPVPRPGVLAAFTALPPRAAQCALSHAVDAAVTVRAETAGAAAPTGERPLIAQPGALAVHVTAALRARAECGAWFCSPDETQWLAAGELTEEAAFGVVRPSAIEAAIEAGGPLSGLLGEFVDCQWPLRYLDR